MSWKRGLKQVGINVKRIQKTRAKKYWFVLGQAVPWLAIYHLLMAAGRSVRTYQQLFKCDTAIHLWAACSKNQSCNRSEISRVSSFKRFWGDALASRITRPAVLTNTSLIAFINLVTINPYVLRVEIGIYSIYPGLPIQDLDFGITTIAKFRPLGQDQDFFRTILGWQKASEMQNGSKKYISVSCDIFRPMSVLLLFSAASGGRIRI